MKACKTQASPSFLLRKECMYCPAGEDMGTVLSHYPSVR